MLGKRLSLTASLPSPTSGRTVTAASTGSRPSPANWADAVIGTVAVPTKQTNQKSQRRAQGRKVLGSSSSRETLNTLSNPAGYPQLAELLQELYETGTAELQLLQAVTGSAPPPTDLGDGQYLNNREEAYSAIQCSDSTVPTDPAAYGRAAVTADESAPDFGRISVFDTTPCAFWQGYDADRYTGPWNRRTAAPILVLNTRNDPATPLEGAFEGAAELYQARVVVTEGAGHSSMYVASACTERVKRDYLFSRVPPPAGTGCSRDRSPFDQPPGNYLTMPCWNTH